MSKRRLTHSARFRRQPVACRTDPGFHTHGQNPWFAHRAQGIPLTGGQSPATHWARLVATFWIGNHFCSTDGRMDLFL